MAPFSRASDNPIAMACFFDVTLRPLPLLSVPFFRRCIALFTVFAAVSPYLRAPFFAVLRFAGLRFAVLRLAVLRFALLRFAVVLPDLLLVLRELARLEVLLRFAGDDRLAVPRLTPVFFAGMTLSRIE